jgi:hypothetical protein
VTLFLDRLPLYSWIDGTSTPPRRKWSVPLPVVLSDLGSPAPSPQAVPQRWTLDTAFTGDAFAWRCHLQDGGLDPDSDLVGTSLARTPLGSARFPIRSASLWLVSNLAALRGQFFPIALDPGITFRNVAQRPEADSDSPLLGMRALLRAGLKVQIDFGKATLSVWTPGPWHRTVTLWLRRALSGFARVPMPW